LLPWTRGKAWTWLAGGGDRGGIGSRLTIVVLRNDHAVLVVEAQDRVAQSAAHPEIAQGRAHAADPTRVLAALPVMASPTISAVVSTPDISAGGGR